MAGRNLTEAQREAADRARRETVEQLHEQLAHGIANLDDKDVWQRWLGMASKLHRYSFNNVVLTMMQKPDATMIAGYRAWQAMGHQVRRGERAIKILGPVTRKVELVDRLTGEPIRDAEGRQQYVRQLVGVRPVSVFDASQVDPPVESPPEPTLLRGQAPPGLWDSLAELVEAEGFQLTRGDCGGANGLTDYLGFEVRVRADIDDAQAVKTLAHELAHVLIRPEPGEPYAGACRGRREVEAESVAYVVAAAHHLDTSQYTFNYVAGWATQAATPQHGIEAVVAETGARVIATADAILAHTKPADLETRLIDAVAEDLGVGASSSPRIAPRPAEPEVWETITYSPSPGALEEARRPIPLDRSVHAAGIET
ncbi:MAG: serine/arginine repetitive matrix protein 2 [Propionibacteriaceae bacterium]|nr:serine/arginine repetitive matrix protein 2 [Propionibacteriaceae bacterium]